MNSINRLEETWTPSWDLGLQDEFGFLVGEEKSNPLALPERPRSWAMAYREVSNRQAPVEGRVARENASPYAEVISFLEALAAEISIDE